MKTVSGNLWEVASPVKVIPTNGITKRTFIQGNPYFELVMGAGVALQAKVKWPDLTFVLGNLVGNHGSNVYRIQIPEEYWTAFNANVLISVPTKNEWRDMASLSLIERNVQHLVALCDIADYHNVALPELGTGYGGLTFAEIEPILTKYLDDRFTLVRK